jgi:hypothetical protein
MLFDIIEIRDLTNELYDTNEEDLSEHQDELKAMFDFLFKFHEDLWSAFQQLKKLKDNEVDGRINELLEYPDQLLEGPPDPPQWLTDTERATRPGVTWTDGVEANYVYRGETVTGSDDISPTEER